jgi:hypothetical protein
LLKIGQNAENVDIVDYFYFWTVVKSWPPISDLSLITIFKPLSTNFSNKIGVRLKNNVMIIFFA